MPELAKRIRVERRGRAVIFEVDGQAFPWYTQKGSISVDAVGDEMPGVTITLIAESVQVSDSLDPGAPEPQQRGPNPTKPA